MSLPKPGGAACAVLVALMPAFARAEEPACPPRGGPVEVVRCVVATSPELARVRRGLDALAARRTSLDVALPSLPLIAVSAAGRGSADDAAFNAYVSLSQEFAIGGQRGARLDVLDAEQSTQARRVVVTVNELVARTLTAYFEYVAALEHAAHAPELRALAEAMTAYARGRVRGELLSEVEGRAVEAEAVHLRIAAAAIDRDITVAKAVFHASLEAPMTPTGVLEPLVFADQSIATLVRAAESLRGETAAAEEEVRVFRARATVLDRAATPNLTVSLLAQRDGFRENVFGAGVSLPIPMPGDAWAATSREASEQRALATQAESGSEAVRRRVRLETLRAHAEWIARRDALSLIPPALVASTKADLETLSRQLQAGTIPIRDALFAQRSLLELLDQDLDARRALALASVELVRAAGLPWPGAAP